MHAFNAITVFLNFNDEKLCIYRIKPIPSQYVKPFVKRSKNDRNDAEAICASVARPSMRTVPVKTMEAQAARIIGWAANTNQQRLAWACAEFGVIAVKGLGNTCCSLAACPSTLPIANAMQALHPFDRGRGTHAKEVCLFAILNNRNHTLTKAG